MRNYQFRQAVLAELPVIWRMFEQGIQRRKAEGSQQWQDGYPNPAVIQSDIEKGAGYVLTEGETIAGYVAVLFNDEPAYASIEGQWLSEGAFVVVHRVVVSDQHLGKGVAKELFARIEALALRHNIFSIKADTNFDNIAMMKVFEKLGYTLCGEVYIRGNARKAYEKVLSKNN